MLNDIVQAAAMFLSVCVMFASLAYAVWVTDFAKPHPHLTYAAEIPHV